MALTQVRRGALEAPWSQASWASVVRRSVVVAGFVLAGVLTGHLDVCVYAAFGALQLGLDEAIVPFRRLLRLVTISTVLMTALSFVAMSLYDTWWTVPLLAAAAFVQGGTMGIGLLPQAAGIGALAMAVIFAGIPGDPAQAAAWLAIGCVVQAAFWLLVWHRERRLAARQVLANLVRSVSRLVSKPEISGSATSKASAEADEALALVRESEIEWATDAERVTDAISAARRSTAAWRVLKDPGYDERLRVQERLRRIGVALERGTRSGDPQSGQGREPATPSVTASSAPGEQHWLVEDGLHADLTALEDAVEALDSGTANAQPSHPGAGPEEPSSSERWAWLHPSTPQFRHGLRLALAIGVAQAVSLLVPLNHSFWIPLTCVFVVKPDWSFTVVRSAARLVGNLLAVVFVPFALLAAGRSIGVALLVAIISAVAFRYFTGNYILGSFGIAGTVLVLDQTLSSTTALYTGRILATVVGAVIGIGASALVPAYRSGQATEVLRDVVGGLDAWSTRVMQTLTDPAASSGETIDAFREDERLNLIRLRPGVEAALVEPRPAADPRCLAVALDAAERAHLSLLALTFQARHCGTGPAPTLDLGAEADDLRDEWTRAATALGLSGETSIGAPTRDTHVGVGPGLTAPTSDEDRAVTLQAIRLKQAAGDLATAAAWIGPPSTTGGA